MASKQGLPRKQEGLHAGGVPSKTSGLRWPGSACYVTLDSSLPWEQSGPLPKPQSQTDLKNSAAYESIGIINYSGQSRKQKGFKCWQDYETQSGVCEGQREGRREGGGRECYFRNPDRLYLEIP